MKSHMSFILTNDIFTCKTTPYLQALKIHCCYGYMIIHAFHSKKNILKWHGLIFHLSLYNKLIEHYIASWGYKMLKIYFTQSFAVLTHEIYFNGQRDILYLCLAMKYPQFSRKGKSLQASRKAPLLQ